MFDTIHYHTDVHHHYGSSGLSEEQFSIIQNQFKKMNDDLLQIRNDLTEAKEKLGKVSIDVDALHAKIDGIPVQPTPEEWAEVKAMAADLKTGLTAVDAKTDDEVTPPL